jgi:hypothetical protein
VREERVRSAEILAAGIDVIESAVDGTNAEGREYIRQQCEEIGPGCVLLTDQDLFQDEVEIRPAERSHGVPLYAALFVWPMCLNPRLFANREGQSVSSLRSIARSRRSTLIG